MQELKISSLSDEERRALLNIARALSYFARERAYGYIDRIANSFSQATLRHVISEALRSLKSERDREGEGGEHKIFMPTASDVEIFLRLAEKDLSVAKIVASLAIAYSWSPREAGEGVR
ncbi:MAG: hypothetical protein QXE01_11640 [Sulfolobales archaeon]